MTTLSRGRKFTHNIINMSRKIGESTADDLHGWIFVEVIYD